MDYQEIIYTKKDKIATVTFNRPKQLNALTALMREEVLDATKDASADDSVRVVVFRGAGKAFCAGADLSQSPRVSGKKSAAPAPNSNLP